MGEYYWRSELNLGDISRPKIWYSSQADKWWMTPLDSNKAVNQLLEHPDAISVTNAYDVLTSGFVEQLRRKAGYFY